MSYIKSPLNYTGGKYKLLNSLFEIFPKDIDTFVDLFAGGFDVGVNANAKTIICNDRLTYLVELYQYLASTQINIVLYEIFLRIRDFKLSKWNVDGYNSLRERYNREKNIVDFLVLTFYSFNHLIRFNNKHEFNASFGKERSSYNESIEKNLVAFCNALQSKNIIFQNNDFLNVDLSNLGKNDFVYSDSPYLITDGVYNKGKRGFKGWTSKEELQLFDFLDKLNDKGVKFALSNVLYHKGLSNDLLIEWSKKYNIHYLDKSYANCSYNLKDKNSKTVEVVVTNY